MILYIIGQDGPTSVTVEIASRIKEKGEDITILAFRESNNFFSKEFNVEIIPLGGESFWDIGAVHRLRKYIQNNSPDVVHVHRTASGFWAPIISAFFSDSRVVRTEHSNQNYYTITQNTVHLFSQLLSDRIICNSRDTYRNLYRLQKWAVGRNWEVVYNGVDVDRIDAASSQGIQSCIGSSGEKLLVGSVGRLIDAKNYSRLIRAFSSVLQSAPDAHLVLIGDGAKRAKLEREAVARGIEDRVTFTGELPRDEVYAMLHRLDLFVMPSLWEGFCNAVVEAMAAGNPVVCSDISTLREVVGDVATYVDPEDSTEIARGIVHVIRAGPEAWDRMGRASRERAVERYALDKTADSYIEVYNKLK